MAAAKKQLPLCGIRIADLSWQIIVTWQLPQK
jgi:hypothetical protein